MRNLRRVLGVGIVSGVVVVSMAAASGSALSVNGGTLQVFTVAGGPVPRGLVVVPECRPLTVPCLDDDSLGGSPSPSPVESPPGTLPPDGTGGGTAPANPGGDPLAYRASLLQPCRDRAACVIYVIRAGDNLVSIVRYFDVAMNETEALNPWLEAAPHLPVGVELRLPWPEWLPGRPVQLPVPTPTQASADPTPGEPTPGDPTPVSSPEPDPTSAPTETPAPTDSPDPTAAPTSDPPESPSPPGP